MAMKTVCCGASVRLVTLIVLCLMMIETIVLFCYSNFETKGLPSGEQIILQVGKFLAAVRCFNYLASFIAIIIKNPCVKPLMITALTLTLLDLVLYAVYMYLAVKNKQLLTFICMFIFLGFKIYATLVFYSYVVELKSRPIPVISIQSDVPSQEPSAPVPTGPSGRMMVPNPQYYAVPAPYTAPTFPHSVQAPQFPN